MRKIFLMIIVSGLVLSFSGIKNIHKQQVLNFEGHWGWIRNASSNRYNFELTILQNGNKIKAYHSIVAMAGNKIDYGGNPDSGDDPSIAGKIENDIATVTFGSPFMSSADDEGIATLTFIAPDKIKWKTVKEIDGENYFPDEAILVRESSLPMSALKEEELTPKPKPSSELEEESEPLLHWGLKLSDRDRGYFDGGVAYQQCKEEQDKEDRDIFDRYRRMPIEGMEWESKAPKLGLGDCREEAFERIKMSTKEYKDGFEKGWRDASMPLNKEKETTKKK